MINIFSLGWFGLIFLNLFFIVVVRYFLIIQTDKFYLIAEEKYKDTKFKFSNYLSFIYFGKKITLLELCYTSKVRYSVFFNSIIHTLLLTIIICSFIIGINNILIGLNAINLFSYNNKYYQKFLTSFLTLIVFFIVNFKYHLIKYKNRFHLNGDK